MKLARNGIKCVSIYGFGDIGRLLVRELKASSILVKDIIDRNAAAIDDGVHTIHASISDIGDVDAVLVTVLEDSQSVVKELTRYTNAQIWTIKDLIYSK